jgi:hypothetical protein
MQGRALEQQVSSTAELSMRLRKLIIKFLPSELRLLIFGELERRFLLIFQR